MEQKRKFGEGEALQILQALGIEMDESHFDDGSSQSKADLRYKTGRYIEVTHTKHNNILFDKNRNHYYSERANAEIDKVYDAWVRLRAKKYEIDENGSITTMGIAQLRKDRKTIKQYQRTHKEDNGIFDYGDAEFKTAIPVITHSLDNILLEIAVDKAPKYPNHDTDLFLYVTNDEFSILDSILLKQNNNVAKDKFLRKISEAPFRVVYICKWNIREQIHITSPIQLIVIYKNENKLNYNRITVEEMGESAL